MQEFYRNIKCDRCGQESGNSEIMLQYTVKRLNNKLYDLCPTCTDTVAQKITQHEAALIEGFVNYIGRECEDK